ANDGGATFVVSAGGGEIEGPVPGNIPASGFVATTGCSGGGSPICPAPFDCCGLLGGTKDFGCVFVVGCGISGTLGAVASFPAGSLGSCRGWVGVTSDGAGLGDGGANCPVVFGRGEGFVPISAGGSDLCGSDFHTRSDSTSGTTSPNPNPIGLLALTKSSA